MRMLAVIVSGADGRTAIRRHTENAVLQEIKSAVVRTAETPGGLHDLIEHGLQARRTGYRTQNAADRALLISELLELAFELLRVSTRGGHGGSLGRLAVASGTSSTYALRCRHVPQHP